MSTICVELRPTFHAATHLIFIVDDFPAISRWTLQGIEVRSRLRLTCGLGFLLAKRWDMCRCCKKFSADSDDIRLISCWRQFTNCLSPNPREKSRNQFWLFVDIRCCKTRKRNRDEKNLQGGGEKFVVKLSEIWQMYDGMTNNLIFIDGGIVGSSLNFGRLVNGL